jgi:predicted DNA-binding transcriptional regulator YafY
LLQETVERPEGFDLAAYWAESSSAYERDAPTTTVEVRIAEDRLWRVRSVFGESTVEASERWPDPDRPGQVRLRMTLNYPDEVPGLLLAVGPNLEVIEPVEIRERVIRLADLVVARYRESAPLEAAR